LETIERKEYMVICGSPQSGKTTLCKDLCALVDSVPGYKSLYVSVKECKTAYYNREEGIQSILASIKDSLKLTYGIDMNLRSLLEAGSDSALTQILNQISELFLQERFVLVIDDADSLAGITLMSVLHQIRSNFDIRGPGVYPTSIVLIGNQDPWRKMIQLPSSIRQSHHPSSIMVTSPPNLFSPIGCCINLV